MNPSNPHPGQTRRRVVVFDADAAARGGLTDLLVDDGFRVVACADVATTLSALDGGDALVVEQERSNGHLVQFLRQVASIAPDLPVFVVTPFGDTEGWLLSERVSTRACFAKPVPYDDLVAALRVCLDGAPEDRP